MRLAVQPAHKGGFVPPHPQDGEMPPEGAEWLADQHTLVLLRDGVLKRTPEPEPEKAKAPAKSKARAKAAPKRAAPVEQKTEPAAALPSPTPPLAASPFPEPPSDPTPRVGDIV